MGPSPPPVLPGFIWGQGLFVHSRFSPTLVPFLNLAPKPEAPPPIPRPLASCDTQHGTPWQQTHRRQQPVCLLPDSGSRSPLHPHCSPQQTTACGFLPFRVTPSCHLLTAAAPAPPRQTAPLLDISGHPRASAYPRILRAFPTLPTDLSDLKPSALLKRLESHATSSSPHGKPASLTTPKDSHFSLHGLGQCRNAQEDSSQPHGCHSQGRAQATPSTQGWLLDQAFQEK